MALDDVACEHLRACAKRFAEAAERFEALAGSLSPEQANWRPEPGRWSAAQCVEHLHLGAKSYFDGMEAAIRRARERGWTGTAPFGRGTFMGRILLAYVEPTAKKKVKAPGTFQPAASGLDFAAVCEDFRGVNRRFGELMTRADDLDLGRVRLATPISRLVRVSLAQAFEIHSKHQLRHLGQAERVTRNEGFPSG